MKKMYIAIDLKSFYASVECVDRGLNPLTTNLVVADESRTEKTICLAVSPSLKSIGIPGRPRLFEVVQKVKEANKYRLYNYRRKIKDCKAEFTGESYDITSLNANMNEKISYITAPPQMARYMQISTEIYKTYLKYIAPEDIHVYSIDEVFIDATSYLSTYNLTAYELAMKLIKDVLSQTGITATAGIGTNMYLCKIAMDIKAKKMPADKDGVRIAQLDEMSYRKEMWSHKPITDFWRVGKGYAAKLEQHSMYTMGDVARMSLDNEDLLYRLFGVNAELLIDHAWGYEPCTIADVKSYKPEGKSLGSGQVLQEPYSYDKAKLVVKEMADLLSLDLVDKRLVTNQIVLTIGYDTSSVTNDYMGEVTTDNYGRKIPKHAHGTINIKHYTSSTKEIVSKTLELYTRIVDENLLVRRISITANRVISEQDIPSDDGNEQLDLFTDFSTVEEDMKEKDESLKKERKRQEAILDIKKRFGKNAILKGMDLEEGATAKNRNSQIGGHKA